VRAGRREGGVIEEDESRKRGESCRGG